MKEKLTEYDIAVITDCLHGSLYIADRAGIWRFPTDQRKAILEKLYEIMSSVPTAIQKN